LGAASINGILCLNQRCARRLVLWNPTNGEFKVIPYDHSEYLPSNRQPLCDLNGFGYDHVTNDYKVIQFVDSYLGGENEDEENEEFVPEDRSSYERFWVIYSLRSNSWRKLDLNLPNHYCFTPNRLVGVYTNGVCHWWARTCDSPNIEDAEECLLSFNFSNELMFTTPRPSYVDVKLRRSFKSALGRCLMLLNESVALISTDLEMDTVHISILGELGVRESWTKLLTVTCLPSFVYAIGVGNLSNTVLFRKNDNKVA
jgi:F-box interacting protein